MPIRIALLLLTLSLSSNADTVSAKDMRSRCRDFTDAGEQTACWGAFTTLKAALVLSDTSGRDPRYWVCLEPNTALAQYVKAFVDYLRRHPNRLSDPFFLVARDALREAFPCPGQ